MITIQRNNKQIAVYKDNDLVYTGDKFTIQRDLDLVVKQNGGDDCEVKEQPGTFTCRADIPDVLPNPKGKGVKPTATPGI